MPSISPVRRDLIYFVLSLLLVGLYVLMADQRHDLGFPLDDSWIHQVYARNLAENGEWAFVPGEPSAASTAPLYSALLAIGHIFDFSPFFWANLLGVLALTLAASMAARIADQLFPVPSESSLARLMRWVGLGTGLAMLLAWHNIWAAASGMETMLFMALSLTVIWRSLREMDDQISLETRPVLGRGLGVGVLGGFLTLTRPEGAALVGIIGFLALLSFGLQRRYLLWAAGIILGWLIITAPYGAWNYDLTGNVLPSTANAKISENVALREDSIPVRYLIMLVPLSAGAQLIGIPGIIAGIMIAFPTDRKRYLVLAPLIWAFVHLTLFVVRLPAPYQHGRYVMPVLPLLLLFMVGGWLDLVHRYRRSVTGRVLTRTLALATAVAFPGFVWIGAGAYANDVRLINTEMVETAQWVRDNVPDDELFAVHDIGALGYFAPRKILDTAGLITPEIVPHMGKPAEMVAFICQQNAKWLMVLPDQRFVQADDPLLELVYESPYFFMDEARNFEGENWKMRVYRLHCPT